MEYYSATKKNEILTFVTTWMNLKGIMLSEISQAEKDKYCVVYVKSKKERVKLIETRSRKVDARGYGLEGSKDN